MTDRSETGYEKENAESIPMVQSFDWRETQSNWSAFQANLMETSTAHLYLPKFEFESPRDNNGKNISKVLSDQITVEDKVVENSNDASPPTLDQMVNQLDDTQRKAYDDILQALRNGDLDAIAKIAQQFDSDPGNFVDVYKCVSKAVREGDFKDTAMIWKYNEQNNSADLRIKQGDKRIAIHIGT